MKQLAVRILIIQFLFAIIYTIVRYHFFKGETWENFPVYVLNKGLGFYSAILLITTFSIRPWYSLRGIEYKPLLGLTRHLGNSALFIALLHAILSLMVLNNSYLDKFFNSENRLNTEGGLSMLTGTIAFVFLLGIYVKTATRAVIDLFTAWLMKQQLLNVTILTLLAVHVFFVGYRSWWYPLTWHGYMPSISLLVFSGSVFGITVILINRFRNGLL